MTLFSSKNDNYLSLAEAAREFGVSQDYLRFLIFKKQLRAVKFGRNWVTTRAWVKEQRSANGNKKKNSAAKPATDKKEGRLSRDISLKFYRAPYLRLSISIGALVLLFVLSRADALQHVARDSFVKLSREARIFLAEVNPQNLYAPSGTIGDAIGNFLTDYSPPFPREIASAVRAVPGKALAWLVEHPMTPEIAAKGVYHLAAAEFSGLIHGSVGEFFISTEAPPSPRQVITGIREDLSDIFTKAEAPSTRPVITVLKNIFDKALALRFPSLVKFIGLKQPQPVVKAPEVTPPQIPPEETSPEKSYEVQPRKISGEEVIQIREVIERREVVSTADVSVFQKKLDEINSFVLTQFSKVFTELTDLGSKVDTKTPFTVFAQSQKIDQLISPTIVSGMNISSGNLTSSGSFDFSGTGRVASDLSVGGTLASGAFSASTGSFSNNVTVRGDLTVNGSQTFSGALTVSSLTATSTTATSSVAYGFFAADKGGLVGIGTSSPFAKLSIAGLGTGAATYALAVSDSASTTRFVIQDNGSVGVGTTSPGTLLSINGPFLAQGTSTINGAGLIADGMFSTSSLNFYTSSNATPRVRITDAGFLGIGTTSPKGLLAVEHIVSNDPALGAFLVADEGTSTPSLIVLNQNGFVGVATRTPGALLSVGGAGLFTATTTILNGGLITEGVTAPGTLGFYTRGTAAPRMVIDSSGNVGIGTTNPGAKLEINAGGNGAIRIGNGDSIQGKNIAGSAGALLSVSAADDSVNVAASGFFPELRLWSNGVERIRVVSSGNVGIGTGTPGTLISVSGTAHIRDTLTVGGTLKATSTALFATEG